MQVADTPSGGVLGLSVDIKHERFAIAGTGCEYRITPLWEELHRENVTLVRGEYVVQLRMPERIPQLNVQIVGSRGKDVTVVAPLQTVDATIVTFQLRFQVDKVHKLGRRPKPVPKYALHIPVGSIR